MKTKTDPTHVRRLLAGASLLAALVVVLAPARAAAQEVVPTSPIYNPGGGGLAGFASNEPGLYFLVPSRWAPQGGAHTPAVRLTVADAAATQHDLRLVLTPDYAHATPAVVAIRGADPRALFFPLPSTIERVTLFLPEALGSVEAELVPDEDGFSTPVALYYRLRFSSAQLAVLRVLAHGGLTLQGAITYEYLAPSGVEETAAPLTIVLDEADLATSTAPAPDPTAWLADLVAQSAMSVPGAIDGPYSLGGGVSVTISNSRVDAWFLPGTWRLDAEDGGVIRLSPTQTPDLAGRVVFDVAQLGLTIRVDYQAALGATLDLAFMRFDIAQLEITKVTVNGAPSPFYTTLLKKLMRDPAVKARVSAALTDELQRRILTQTLFGLEGVLP